MRGFVRCAALMSLLMGLLVVSCSGSADWAEQAVRDAVAVHQDEAVRLRVVDFQADSLIDLLTKADGRSVQVAAANGATTTLTLKTANAPLHSNDPTLLERVLYH